MILARRYDVQLLQRGHLFTIVYKHGSHTVTSRDRAQQLFNALRGK